MKRKPTTKAKPTTPLPLSRSKYQIFPPHPAPVHEAMDASITHHRIENATVWDDQGNCLDGWERENICAAKGITCPREVRHFESEADKFRFVLAVNAHRRPNLSQKQKRAVIEAYLKGDPEIADNALAQALGVSKNTVLAVRQRLEASRQIRKVTRTRGRDGRLRPVRYSKRIVTNSLNEFRKAQEIIGDLPDACAGKTLDINTAKRRAARSRTKEAIEARRIIVPLPDDAVRLYHCRFQELEQVAGIVPASANLLLTDIPYGKDFLTQLDDLAALAERVLVDGGLFVTYTGQFYLPQYIAAFDRHLTYRWTCTSINWQANFIFPLNILSQHKPILIFSKGDWRQRGQWPDVLREPKEKDVDPWQQSLSEAERLLSYFSGPGDLVIDPCGGGFTTAVACLRLGRRCVSCDVETGCVSRGRERLDRVRNSMTLGA